MVPKTNLAVLAADLDRVSLALRQTGISAAAPAGMSGERHTRIAFVRAMLRRRRKFEDAFPGGGFGDPARDMLLDLYASELEGKTSYVTSLVAISGAPPTTSLRTIGLLAEQGWLVRERDRTDGRRTLVSLTPETRRTMDRWVDETVASFSSARHERPVVL